MEFVERVVDFVDVRIVDSILLEEGNYLADKLESRFSFG